MNGLDLALGESAVVGYILAAARTAGFVFMAPPFNARGIPARARGTVAIGLAMPLSVNMQQGAPNLESTDFALRVGLQVLTGVVMGAFVQLAVNVVQMLGDLLDVVGGFTLSLGMDPLQLTQTSVMGRLHQLMALTLLFVTDGHLIVLQGLSRSVQLMPEPKLDTAKIAEVVTHDFAQLFMAAVQIAAPVMGALLIADIALGLMTRAAPALNAFSLAFPLKISLSLLLIGLVIVQVPQVLERAVEEATFTVIRMSGG